MNARDRADTRLCFLGDSHAQCHLQEAAAHKGFTICEMDQKPHVVFVSQDTPIADDGTRDQRPIQALCMMARRAFDGPVVLTSQVEPGFTRSLNLGLYHQAETLRMRDARERARNPEMMIVGVDGSAGLPTEYFQYLKSFGCVIVTCSLEEAEFAKIAINMMLAAQVDSANRLAAAAKKTGANWARVADIMRHDSRIGKHAYLTPGRWQDSKHLLRDAVTLAGIEGR